MGRYTIEKLGESIETTKYVLLFHNVLHFIVGGAMFAISMWLKTDSGLSEWISWLEAEDFYIGIYILIVASMVTILSSFLGCAVSYLENNLFSFIFIGSQIFCFLTGSVGSAVLLEYSTMHSSIQPLIRESIRKMIINPHHVESRTILAAIQENIGCCGADGAQDYTSLRQPIPEQCRDTITGNAYFYGCVEELTWFFESKTEWLAGLTMAAGLMQVINVVITVILLQAIKRESKILDSINNKGGRSFD